MWNSAEALEAANGEYVQIGIDLSAFEKTIRFGFSFDSGDASKNKFGGVHIDKLALHMICGAEVCKKITIATTAIRAPRTPAPSVSAKILRTNCCSKTADCDDESCTVDKCVNTKCKNTVNPDTIEQCCPENAWSGNAATSFD